MMTEFHLPPQALVDTHCHLDAPTFVGRVSQVVAMANDAGVKRFVVPGVSASDWQRVAAIADNRLGIYGAFGLHPMHAVDYSPTLIEQLREFLPRAVAIGEIGLDYLFEEVPRALQIEAFRQQLRLAVETGLPVLIHCRRAFKDMLVILREERVQRVGGVMHAFSGSPEVAMEAVRLGFLISVAGPVTYLNAVRPRRVVEVVPLRHLVLETDAPDLAPEPHRGGENEPSYLPRVAEMVAEIKGVPYEEVAETTTANARRLFGF